MWLFSTWSAKFRAVGECCSNDELGLALKATFKNIQNGGILFTVHDLTAKLCTPVRNHLDFI